MGIDWKAIVDAITIVVLIRVALLILLGIPFVFWLSRFVRIYVGMKHSQQRGFLAGKIVYYTGLTIIVITVLRETGFPLTPFLGAAGVVGVALGFASQTSLSNVISGIFLIAEKPFEVGDTVTIGDFTGEVLSIDTLSVKLRSFDNKFVRIPNETIVKSQITNLTRFPIRRIDLSFGIAYKEDPEHVRRVLMDIVHKNPQCLEDPEAIFRIMDFGSSSVNILFAVWVLRGDYFTAKNEIMTEILRRFAREGIEIPFPHLSVYAGSATAPIPVRLENDRS
ncbi:MAG TPA: mechanosensitive ion channel family protein [Candidatus Sumerlaeota bacterium]|nr:mechanosensitive ion channel family protein [Candidatus Sumerlaeota bacterium]